MEFVSHSGKANNQATLPDTVLKHIQTIYGVNANIHYQKNVTKKMLIFFYNNQKLVSLKFFTLPYDH